MIYKKMKKILKLGNAMTGINAQAKTAKAEMPTAPTVVRQNILQGYIRQTQEQTQWCWAACAASVGNYYNESKNYTQCYIAYTSLKTKYGSNTPNCCVTPASCNTPWNFVDPLEAVNSYGSNQQGQIDFEIIQEQIDKGRPIGTCVEWSGGGAHFMMITGYNGNNITIQDPQEGQESIEYSSYTSKYGNSGKWTWTYFTK